MLNYQRLVSSVQTFSIRKRSMMMLIHQLLIDPTPGVIDLYKFIESI